MLRRIVALLVMLYCLLIPSVVYAPTIPTSQGRTIVPVTKHLKRHVPTDIECLAQTIYWEAASEGMQSWGAVADVIFTRLQAPEYPKTICAVVLQPYQFSWTLAPRSSPPNSEVWQTINHLARQWVTPLGKRNIQQEYGDLEFFHATAILPDWASSSTCTPTQFGTQLFYSRRCMLEPSCPN